MNIAVFDTHSFERETLSQAAQRRGFSLQFFDVRLRPETAALVRGFDVVCVFVNDRLDEAVLREIRDAGIKLIALRCAGFNQINLGAAAKYGIKVVRVPEYSPYAVAEHAVALLLTLNRKIHRAYDRVHSCNFSLDGLVGFDLHGKTVGVVGTGKIGSVMARIMRGFGCTVLAYDLTRNTELENELGVRYVDLPELFRRSDIVSLHVPLTPRTLHLVNADSLNLMKPGVFLINTGRGGLIDTRALIAALKSRRLGAAALDVYEEEEGVFFNDLSDQIMQDDVLARLITFPNVLITSHQAFLTREALNQIAETTFRNIADFVAGRPLINEVRAEA